MGNHLVLSLSWYVWCPLWLYWILDASRRGTVNLRVLWCSAWFLMEAALGGYHLLCCLLLLGGVEWN